MGNTEMWNMADRTAKWMKIGPSRPRLHVYEGQDSSYLVSDKFPVGRRTLQTF